MCSIKVILQLNGTNRRSLHPISYYFVDNRDHIFEDGNEHPHKAELIYEYIKSERIFNDWSRLRCVLALTPLNTCGMSLDAQLKLKDPLQLPSRSSRVPWCNNGCGFDRS
ncbi:hypothetical protein TNCV_4229161 [Trichonephila clavipes]|nr:hypothetical protein TNCV_4229161 [Trichonephila clavipes]